MKKLILLFFFFSCSFIVPAQEQPSRVNETPSPDSSMVAFTRDNDLWVADAASGKETRLTYDGNDLILNGYASWVYYEEIFGRPSRYKAFWWSPDSRKIAFYRFDNSQVPMFPIFLSDGQDGSLRQTRYPKCGEPNPKVWIYIVDLSGKEPVTVQADFDPQQDQYFGTPVWGADSKSLFVSREPRVQNTLDLYSVSAADGSKTLIYHETYKTWLDWIDGMLFGKDGLYMVRSFETLWQQIYYLSYDGKTLRALTDGPNWRVTLRKLDEKRGELYFTAERDSRVRQALYKLDSKGRITAVSDTSMHVQSVTFSEDGNYATATLSNLRTPSQTWKYDLRKPSRSEMISDSRADIKDFDALSLPELVWMTTKDGLRLPGYIIYPHDFDPSKRYPVHVDIYGGPDSPQVTDRWLPTTDRYQWWADNGIIEATLDCRASGHNGREGLDQIYRRLDSLEVLDFVEWADWLKALPYVEDDKIGVEGFSFGGTMTALLVMDHPDAYHYGIAGGGVYDWALYDTHYTERFMDTPQNNPEGYAATRAISHVKNYPVEFDGSTVYKTKGYDSAAADSAAVAIEPVMLRINHGTGDDNVHFQNTLQLVKALQNAGKKFDLMIYTDGMHGYGGGQRDFYVNSAHEFWLKYLKNR